MQVKMNYENGRVVIECDSNSMAAWISIAEAALDQAGEMIDKKTGTPMSEADDEGLQMIEEYVSDVSLQLVDLDNQIANYPTDLPFYTEAQP